ncbi:bacterial Ig-like domain-containing protein [Lactococcus petauri]|uniref:bacterial Ig-like domain-containing protein n=1 Tax=Lactococcus petauri TaxID=1940789 RepID=UPI001CD82C0A|nr:bacterial Ig-like domain-containing protein [Lactococcus petauri]
MRTGSQWFLISLMTTSTFLPGITATVSASTRENTISQNSDIIHSENNEGIDTDQDKDVEKIIEDDDNVKSLAIMHEDEKDTDNLTAYENTEILNDDTDIEKSLKESDDIDSGIIGSADWRIDSTGTLHISEGDMGAGAIAGKWGQYASVIKKISFDGKILAAKNLLELFSGLNQVTEIEHLSNLDTTNVTKMSGLFKGMSSLTSLDLSNFDTSKVTDMSSMFLGCSSLTSLDLSNFDTSNVTTMSSMFSGMSSLNDLNISNFNTAKVTNMYGMFLGPSSLTELDLSNFDTSNVSYMHNMFANQSSLSKLDISSFRTPNLITSSSMFSGASAIEKLDLSGFETSNETIMSGMFRGMSNLSQVKLGGSFTFAEGSAFPGPVKSSEYTGNWINVATGTVDSPLGANIWSPAEMMTNYNPEIDADTYVWERTVAAEDVTVRYVDSQGEEIHSSQNISGNVGDVYDSSTSAYKLIIDGYTLDESKLPENATGELGDKAQTVTYVYNKNKALGSVTLRYVDTFGQPIEDLMFGSSIGSLTFEGEVGNSADDDLLFVDAVGWVRLSELPTGVVYSDSPQTFDIVYDRAGTIYVNYEDTNGVKLKPEWRNTDYLSQFNWTTGEYPSPVAYEVSPLDIPGYEMIRVEGDSAKGDIELSEIKHVTFVYSNPVVVNVHDSTLYVGDEWSPEANFDSAFDKDGKAVDFKDVKVAGEADTTKAGSYEVTYSYGGVESKATITVKDNQTAVNVHDSTLYVGDEWSPETNFDSAFDKDGKAIDFKDVKVSGNVDTTKAGNYNITYSYDGLEETATVTVIKIEEGQDLAHIVVHDSELKVGDDWSPQDNFDKATSSEGKEVSFSDVVVSGAVDTKKPGTYEVTYSIPEDHWGRNIVEGRHTATAKIVVSEEKDNDDRDSNSKGENSDSDKNNSSSTDNISGKNDFQNTKRLPKTGEHTSALIFMMGIAFLVLGSIFSVLRIKKNKK